MQLSLSLISFLYGGVIDITASRRKVRVSRDLTIGNSAFVPPVRQNLALVGYVNGNLVSVVGNKSGTTVLLVGDA